MMAHSPVSSTLRKLRCKYGGSVLATWGKEGGRERDLIGLR